MLRPGTRDFRCCVLRDDAITPEGHDFHLNSEATWSYLFAGLIHGQRINTFKVIDIYTASEENYNDPILCGIAMGAINRDNDPGLPRLIVNHTHLQGKIIEWAPTVEDRISLHLHQ
jgi:hypothetical protein